MANAILSKRCYSCGVGWMELVAKPGRVRAYKRGLKVEFPADLKVYTCSKCGTESLTESMCKAVDAAFEEQNKDAKR